MFSAEPYSGPLSDHFDGKQFHNQERGWHKSGDFWRWMRQRRKAPWPKWVDVPAQQQPRRASAKDKIRATFINHATVLVEMPGLTFITDPIWSDRCSPISFFGPKRVHRPGLRLEDLPKIDAILISHNHYDHMDIPTLRKLLQHQQPRIFSGLGNKRYLEERGVAPVTELDWWQAVDLDAARKMTFVPGRHFSARSFKDRNHTLWGGFVVSQKINNKQQQLYFAGDTGYGMHFKQIFAKFGQMDFSMIPIGAYEPRWFMKLAHVNPEEAVQGHLELQSKKSLGIHFGTFQLTDEPRDEPLMALQRALEANGVQQEHFITLQPGESYEF